MSPRSLARDGDRVLASVPAISSSARLYSLTSANTEQRFERAASGRARPAEADLQLGASLLAGRWPPPEGRRSDRQAQSVPPDGTGLGGHRSEPPPRGAESAGGVVIFLGYQLTKLALAAFIASAARLPDPAYLRRPLPLTLQVPVPGPPGQGRAPPTRPGRRTPGRIPGFSGLGAGSSRPQRAEPRSLDRRSGLPRTHPAGSCRRSGPGLPRRAAAATMAICRASS